MAFVSWARVPGAVVPSESIPDLVPDLAIEVLSESNTPKEMALTRSEYFEAGVRVVWMVDPVTRKGTVYTSPTEFTSLTEAEALDGGEVLPGFTLALSRLFAELDRRGN